MEPKSDGDGEDSPAASSRYSSCGDSEFDRYCSANSAMGTPSVRSARSSLAFNDALELHGFDNYGFDNCGFENRVSSDDRKIGFLGSRESRGDAECSETDLCGNEVGGFIEDSGFEDRKIGFCGNRKSRIDSEVDLYGNEIGGNGEMGFENQKIGFCGGSRFEDRKIEFCKGSGSKDRGFEGRFGLEDQQAVFWNNGESRMDRECREVDLHRNEVAGFEGLGGSGKRVFEDRTGTDNRKVESWRGNCESNRVDLYGNEVELECGDDISFENFGLRDKGESGIGGREGVVSENDWKTGFCEGGDSEESGVSRVDMCENEFNGLNDGAVGVHEDVVALNTCSDEREMQAEEYGASSGYEHSEDENSMYNYGTDDEAGNVSYFPKDVRYIQETRVENENPLCINTSVAFGLEDWNEFLQESGEGNIGFEVCNNFEERRDQNFGLKRDYVGPKLQGSIVSPNVSQTEHINSTEIVSSECIQLPGSDALSEDTKFPSLNHKDCTASIRCGDVGHARDITGNRGEHNRHSSITSSSLLEIRRPVEDDGGDVSTSSQQQCDLSSNFGNVLEKKQQEVRGDTHSETSKKNMSCNIQINNVVGTADCQNQQIESLEPQVDPLSNADAVVSKNSSVVAISPECMHTTTDEEFKTNLTKKSENLLATADLHDIHLAQMKAHNIETNEFYEDFVHEMEEILLDSVDSPGGRYTESNKIAQRQPSLPSRDGGSSASTSGRDSIFDVFHGPDRIDGIEVIGAKQKRGSVSFSERLVGVKEYTVYKICVWSGNNKWEIERRYRDFYTLYRQLKASFSRRGLSLPSPWSSVEKESRKLFGNVSPNVVAERSTLIQECLQSILHCRSLASPPDILMWFLSPQESHPSSPASNIPVLHSTPFSAHANMHNIPTLGKTISLIVEIQPSKSTRQMLEAQHYTCAGCHKRLDDGKTLVQDIMQTFGWAKPRLCEYTGQLFCSSCHTNDAALLPARVLHHWDFTLYPVSQMAKSYLDSIHDKPMLCVSAVNPFLFSKVPALYNVVGIRKRIASMMPYISCPYRRSINKGLGSRIYLLESNEFFALKDLIDLSKGVFAALPVMLETVSSKIQEHITEQCLVCCEKGVPCGARQFCSDPSSLIFPFQEGEIERCTACDLAFHKSCFKRLLNCSCGAYVGSDEATAAREVSRRTVGGTAGPFNLLRSSGSGLSMRLLSGLFSKSEKSHKDGDNLISLGSLPSNSL